jgi:hypothetical protein
LILLQRNLAWHHIDASINSISGKESRFHSVNTFQRKSHFSLLPLPPA